MDKVAQRQVVHQLLRLSLVTIIPLRIHTHFIYHGEMQGGAEDWTCYWQERCK